MNPVIVEQAAIMQHGIMFTMPRPCRHADIIRAMVLNGVLPLIDGRQGFLLSDGTFADRGKAAGVAWNAAQTRGPDALHRLYTEDLW